MLQKFEQTHSRLGGRHTAIDAWLEERKDVLVRFCQLSGLSLEAEQAGKDRALPTSEEVGAFCDVLMDYVSAGHFEIYERLMGELESSARDEASGAVRRLYPQIAASTDTVLAFDEKYGERLDDELWPDFDADLSRLGEALATRFELEDELITLFGASRAEPQPAL